MRHSFFVTYYGDDTEFLTLHSGVAEANITVAQHSEFALSDNRANFYIRLYTYFNLIN